MAAIDAIANLEEGADVRAKLTLTLSAGASCLLSGFDLHGEVDSLGSALVYTKDNP